MNERQHRRTVVALVLVAIMLAPFAQLGRVAGAQDATPVPGAQTWHVLVNNVSPPGENWSFNTFYPDHLQAHPATPSSSPWRRIRRPFTPSISWLWA